MLHLSDYTRVSKKHYSILKKALQAVENTQESNGKEASSLLKSLEAQSACDKSHIVRGITLEPAQWIPGIALIHYAEHLLHEIYPDLTLTFTLEHKGDSLRYIIEVEEDQREQVEALLERYSAVLLGTQPVDTISEEEAIWEHVKHMLDMSALQVKIAYDMQYHDGVMTSDMQTVQEGVKQLHHAVGHGLSSMRQLQRLITDLLSEEREAINQALHVLDNRIQAGDAVSEQHEEEVKKAFAVVQEHEPDVFAEMRQLLNNSSASGSAGNTLYSWLVSISGAMPR